MSNTETTTRKSVTRTGKRDCRSFHAKRSRMTEEEKRANAERFTADQRAAEQRLIERMQKSFTR